MAASPGGAPPAGGSAARLTGAQAQHGQVLARLAVNEPGKVHLFVVDANGVVLGDRRIDVDGQGDRDVPIAVGSGIPARVLAGFSTANGATAAYEFDISAGRP